MAHHVTKHHSSESIDVHILQKVIGVLDRRQVGRGGLQTCLKQKSAQSDMLKFSIEV